jgi:hypothetical protein
MDMGAVITVGEDHKKKVLMHPLVNPRFSILDPEYCVFRPNPATIPTGKRPPFQRESGRHSDSNPATIPEPSGQCDMRV